MHLGPLDLSPISASWLRKVAPLGGDLKIYEGQARPIVVAKDK